MSQEGKSICCAGAPPVKPVSDGNRGMTWYLMIGLPMLAAWVVVYHFLPAFSAWFTHSLLGLEPGRHLSESVKFFVLDTPKVFMLLILVVFGMGVVRSFFTGGQASKILVGKRESVGNVLAALLGIVTPFCSCSAVPLFIGFLTSGVPLGVTFSFLISAPMVNEVALVLLFGLFGWKVAGIYLGTGLIIAIVAGWVIGRMKLEKYVEPWVYQIQAAQAASEERQTWPGRVQFGLQAVREIVGKVWPYLIGGIAVGAGIHGYVPEGVLASVMGKGAWWAVPLAVLIGIPMYSNAAGIIPVVQALIAKGAALGTVLAFMMAVVGLSLPEMIILRKVLTPRLIAIFIGVVGSGILIVGYLFNLINLQ